MLHRRRNRPLLYPPLLPECRPVTAGQLVVAKLARRTPLLALVLKTAFCAGVALGGWQVVMAGLESSCFDCRGGGDALRSTQWMMAKQFAEEAYPRWRADNPGKVCPSDLYELTRYMNHNELYDDQNRPLFVMLCGPAVPDDLPNHFGVVHVGTDGYPGTEDDIKSWEKKPND